MTTVMTRAARESFLSAAHVGVLSVADPGDAGGTLAVPIWYDFTPERGVWVITSPTSAKAKALDAAGRYAIVVQEEQIPYRYVSVEGPITDVRPVDLGRDLLPMAVRYFGEELGTRYAEHASAADLVYTMRPRRWASADMTSAFTELGATA